MRRSLLLALLGMAVALAHLHGALDFIERAFQDVRARLTSRPATGEVIVVGIESNSLAWLANWPWPRRYHAAVVERLSAAGAAAMALDVDFSSSSLAEDDARLVAALAALGSQPIALPVFRPFSRRQDGTVEAIDTAPLRHFRAHAALVHVDFRPDPDG